ncbi:ATP-binding protein [Enterococcus cecorum]|uniref:ATP-binding protein n=1 Tax=Enterococcus cecorum TaxID=44008 RepID=UPI0032631DC1
MQRKEIPEIPIEAVREALLNSFCHKDYSVGESNEVAIYPDRIEIYNPGTFPNGLDPEDYIDRIERPVRRNPQIARLLYYSKDIESFGTGLRRIAQYCKMSGVRYEFQKKKTGFVVCFYRNKMSTVHDTYDMLEDGDKKPINQKKADKKPINQKKADKNSSINGRTRKNRPNYRLYQCTRRNYK